jgi:hypothetical protein
MERDLWEDPVQDSLARYWNTEGRKERADKILKGKII